jgi:hypothetical protein
MPIIPALWRQRQEGRSYTSPTKVRPYFQSKIQQPEKAEATAQVVEYLEALGSIPSTKKKKKIQGEKRELLHYYMDFFFFTLRIKGKSIEVTRMMCLPYF